MGGDVQLEKGSSMRSFRFSIAGLMGLVLLAVISSAFQIAGHCLLALIAAGLGGATTPVVRDLARRGNRDIARS
jgi:hypothetical protein